MGELMIYIIIAVVYFYAGNEHGWRKGIEWATEKLSLIEPSNAAVEERDDADA